MSETLDAGPALLAVARDRVRARGIFVPRDQEDRCPEMIMEVRRVFREHPSLVSLMPIEEIRPHAARP